MLNKILTQVLKLKESGSPAEVVSFTNEKMKESFDIDIEELYKIISSRGLAFLKKEKNFTNENLNILADIFFELAEKIFDDINSHHQSLELYSQSLNIYEFIEKDDRTYSIDRNVKITKIKDILD